jgi:histone deacetylase 1/2
MTLTECKYALDLPHSVSTPSTPLVPTERLARDTSSPLGTEDSCWYNSIVGGLEYFTLTCTYISFAVNKVCQFLARPSEVHWEAVKRIMRYVKWTLNTGLTIHKSPFVGIGI